jgi:hypothetical protein
VAVKDHSATVRATAKRDCATAGKKGAAAEKARKERRSIGVMISQAEGNTRERSKVKQSERWSCKEDFMAGECLRATQASRRIFGLDNRVSFPTQQDLEESLVENSRKGSAVPNRTSTVR